MATFLSLCNDVERESGTVAGGAFMTDVEAPPTARQQKVVKWTAAAWDMIQTMRPDWRWMIDEFSHVLTIGQARYTATDLGIARFADWVVDQCSDDYFPFSLYDTAIGVADECAIRHVSYEFWRQAYGRGAQQQNRPVHYAIGRQNELCLGQVPDKAYRLNGEYRASPQPLVENDDVPEMPPQFHQAIVWKAVMLLGQHDEGPVQIATAQTNFLELYRSLVNAQTGTLT